MGGMRCTQAHGVTLFRSAIYSQARVESLPVLYSTLQLSFTPARRIDVISPGIVGIDGAVVGVVLRTVEGVFVEAALGHYPLRILHVAAAADEELDVALKGVSEENMTAGKCQGCIPSRSSVGSNYTALSSGEHKSRTLMYRTYASFGKYICASRIQLSHFRTTLVGKTSRCDRTYTNQQKGAQNGQGLLDEVFYTRLDIELSYLNEKEPALHHLRDSNMRSNAVSPSGS